MSSTKTYSVAPIAGPLHARIRPPGSKSVTNRAFVCAALADGPSFLSGVLDSEDTQVMIDALRQLGIAVELVDEPSNRWRVEGCKGTIPRPAGDIFTANSGTTIRFLAAALAVVGGQYTLDGVERMRQRPIGDLVDALVGWGAVVRAEPNRCPPVHVSPQKPEAQPIGGVTRVRGDISSQYLSGLLMAAPYAGRDAVIEVEGTLVSQPYVWMTLGVMRSFGLEIEAAPDLSRFVVRAPRTYRGCEYTIEPDASAASYFWGAAAIAGGDVLVEGLGRDALQGDVRFCECLERMGCEVEWAPEGTRVTGGKLRGVALDMNDISDTVQTLAAVALFAEGPTTITGVGHIRHKETDRIGDLARELRKLGATVEEFADGLKITPGPLRGCPIDTYRDHRMAMSLALVGLKVPGVVIRDPDCTQKTYPEFFDDLERVCRTAT